MLVASIGGQVTRTFEVFFSWLPHLVGALIVLLLGYVVARVVGGIIAKATDRAGLDRTLHSGPGGGFISKVTASPSPPTDGLTYASGAPTLTSPDKSVTLRLIAK
jgi:hypothetical protein